MRPGNIESESEDLAALKQNCGFHPGAASSSSPTVPKQHAPAGSSPSSALRSLHTEHFEPPRPSLVQVIVTLIAYFLLITDIPRAGLSIDELPYKQIEPNVYSMYGPTILPTMPLVRAYDAADPTKSTISSPTNSDGVPTTSFKFETSSYGLRSILAERVDLMTWSKCMTNYDDACDDVLALDLVFEMLENLVGTIVDNAENATSYKSMSDHHNAISRPPGEIEIALEVGARLVLLREREHLGGPRLLHALSMRLNEHAAAGVGDQQPLARARCGDRRSLLQTLNVVHGDAVEWGQVARANPAMHYKQQDQPLRVRREEADRRLRLLLVLALLLARHFDC